MKKLTKSQLESLPSVSVRGQRYVEVEALQALLAEQDDAVQAESDSEKSDSKRAR